MTYRKLLILIITILYGTNLLAQNQGQILRGTLIDQVSHQPIAYANVVLSDSIVVSTDDDGKFRFENIQTGQYSLGVSYIGYEKILLRNISIDAGKEAIYNLTMVESTQTMEEVVISGAADKSKPLNEMSLLSTRMVGVEETKKYASSFNDPARMANSFAGVVQTNAGSNDIAIRGNAPNGLLWRLEGVDIPNPNHFSSVGTAGGGVSILSGQLLGNSDFSTGAFTSEYGNALSGVFDIKLRKGNNEKREHTLQFGVLGIDAAVEGPFTKSGDNSYLVNYRYSTLGILSKSIDLGGFVTTFQDLSYNFSFKNKKYGDLTFFGINGLSSQTGHDSIYSSDLDFVANTLVNGMTHSKTLGKNSFLKSAVVYSKTTNKIVAIKEDDESGTRFTSNDDRHINDKFTLSSKYQHKVNAATSFKTGVIQGFQFYDENKSNRDSFAVATEQYYNKKGSTATTQVFAQILNRTTPKLTMSGGLHVLYNWLNDTKSIEPRLGLKYATTSNQSVSLGYGLHSQINPLGVYFVETNTDGYITNPNSDLEMSKAHHFVLGYNYKPTPFLNFKLEGYYQSLFDVPIGLDPSENVSLLNIENSTIDEIMTNQGKGRNYGVEFTVEKYLNKGYYFTATSSIYNSEYKSINDEWHDTRFNGGFASSVTGGKEFTISKKKKRTMGIHFKSIYTGGLRQSPIDIQQSLLREETVRDESRPYSEQLPNYFRFDLKLSFKRNYKTVTSSFIIDIQNIANRENVSGDEYNAQTKKIERFTQVGLLPIISYKLEF